MGGDDVDGRVTDIHGVAGRSVEHLQTQQQRTRVRLVRIDVLVRDEESDVEVAQVDGTLRLAAALGRHYAGADTRSVEVRQQFGNAVVPADQTLGVGLVEGGVNGEGFIPEFLAQGGVERVDQGHPDPALDFGWVPLAADHLFEGVLIARHDQIDGVGKGAVQVEQDHGPARRHGVEPTVTRRL